MKCILLDAFDPVILGVIVAVGVVGMERGSTEFFRLILGGDCRVSAQINCKGKVPINLVRAVGVKMKLVRALSGSWVVAPAITTTRQAKLAETFITERFH